MSTLSGGSAIVKDGLVFYVDPANTRSYSGTGSVFRSLSTYNNVGNLTGSPTVSYFRPENGGIYRFHTTAPSTEANINYIIFGTQSYPNGIDPLTGLTNSTISIFVRLLQTTGVQVLLGRYGDMFQSGYLAGGFLLSYSTGKFYMEHRTGPVAGNPGTHYENVSSSTAPNQNQWYHVCGTIEGNQRKMYINGVLETATASGFGNTMSFISVRTFIANQSDASGYMYSVKGDLSCAMIYNRALSASEVSQNFNTLRYRFGI